MDGGRKRREKVEGKRDETGSGRGRGEMNVVISIDDDECER